MQTELTRTRKPKAQPSKTNDSERLIVEGGSRLRGSIAAGGSKNTVLPLMTGALLAPGRSTIYNVSVLHDVWTLADALESLGCTYTYNPDRDPNTPETLVVDATHVNGHEPPVALVNAMRASFYLLGALLGRCGKARVGLPGGDAWGARPVNLHLQGMKAFGAEIEIEEGAVTAVAPGGRLRGGNINLEPSSVGATVNLLLAAVRARGSSRITNAAREPDVVVFGEMLRAMGARINGLGSDVLEIEGVDELHPVVFRNASDRIEVGTYMIAAVLAGEPGRGVRITNAEPDHLGNAFLDAFRCTGAGFNAGASWIEVVPPERIRPVPITTAPYPGFPTDLQAQWTVMMTRASGPAIVTDPIYPERFQHVP
ncbi:MAG TPA: UDP-N-acetylglucosamine 1-carboxyvinyltransferase, partial [Rhodothermales bacterium]|nr:UDP-N-acetylglucosamine 1-carboxyvinyltransferase [Rhodothermales bacterium]